MSAGKQAFQMLTHRKKKKERERFLCSCNTHQHPAGWLCNTSLPWIQPPTPLHPECSEPTLNLSPCGDAEIQAPLHKASLSQMGVYLPHLSSPPVPLTLCCCTSLKDKPCLWFPRPPYEITERAFFSCNKTIKGFRRNNEFMYNKWPLFLGPPPPSFFSHLQASRALWPECALILLCMSWNHCAPKWQEGYSKNEINITVQNPPMNKTGWALKSPTRVGHVLLISLRCKSRWSVGE